MPTQFEIADVGGGISGTPETTEARHDIIPAWSDDASVASIAKPERVRTAIEPIVQSRKERPYTAIDESPAARERDAADIYVDHHPFKIKGPWLLDFSKTARLRR